VQVPNVVGSYLDDAIAAIWYAGFGYTVETVQSNQPVGIVVSTDPSGGTQLDPNSKRVTIRQSSGPPEPAPAPPTEEPAPTATSQPATPQSTGDTESGQGSRQRQQSERQQQGEQQRQGGR
jgi:serine/threonine-protein kinase